VRLFSGLANCIGSTTNGLVTNEVSKTDGSSDVVVVWFSDTPRLVVGASKAVCDGELGCCYCCCYETMRVIRSSEALCGEG
jgi:hypothetical protein